MNYYEHHIGDYAEATAHLTFIEDATYSRLIRKYYATEKPLPIDVKLVQRLITARSKEEKNSVISVLNEFFTLTDDGWRQERCDHEIARFKDKQIKARRSAEGRWQAFQSDDLRQENDPHNSCVRIATALRTQCSPDTKHQTPVTNLHTPDKQNNRGENEKVLQGDGETKKQIKTLFEKEGLNIGEDDERIAQLIQQGLTVEDVEVAIAQAKEMRRRASSSTPINAGFVLAILKGMHRKAHALDSSEEIWWKSNEGIDLKGRELGMRAQGSESYDSFKTRIFSELRKRKEIPATMEASNAS
jgi:uncharacterized protein YdaU (DUF1376 family)